MEIKPLEDTRHKGQSSLMHSSSHTLMEGQGNMQKRPVQYLIPPRRVAAPLPRLQHGFRWCFIFQKYRFYIHEESYILYSVALYSFIDLRPC